MPEAVSHEARPVTPTTIVAAELDRLCRELRDGTVTADAAVVSRLHRVCDIAVGLDRYVDRCTSSESPALAALARRTQETMWDGFADAPVSLEQEMLSGHVEGRFLQFLLHLGGARRVLEVGMFTGYSALAMAEALPADGSVVACELDPNVATFARECFSVSPDGAKITVEVGPAAATLAELDEQCRRGDREPFDFVFVDADKASYGTYLDLLLDGSLLAADGVIAVDNTLLQGEPYSDSASRSTNGAAIAAFNDRVAVDPRVEQVLVPLRDGVTLIRRVGAP